LKATDKVRVAPSIPAVLNRQAQCDTDAIKTRPSANGVRLARDLEHPSGVFRDSQAALIGAGWKEKSRLISQAGICRASDTTTVRN